MIHNYSLLGSRSKWTIYGSKWTGVKLDSKWTVSKSKVDGLKGKNRQTWYARSERSKRLKVDAPKGLMWTASNKKVDGPKSRKRATLLVCVQLHTTTAFACTVWYFWIIHCLLFDRPFSLWNIFGPFALTFSTLTFQFLAAVRFLLARPSIFSRMTVYFDQWPSIFARKTVQYRPGTSTFTTLNRPLMAWLVYLANDNQTT